MDKQELAAAKHKELKKFNSRKFILSCVIWLAGSLGWATNMMTAAEWAEFSRWILTLYMIGNVSESALDMISKR